MNCKQCGQKLCKTSYTCVECGFDNTPEALRSPVEPVKKKKGLKITIAIITCIALLAGLAEAVHFGITGRIWPYPNDIFNKSNYYVSDSAAAKNGDAVVATLGESTLTNGQLRVFYWMTAYTSLNNYEGARYDMPFHEQVKDKNTGLTWQQYFLECALDTWQEYQTFYTQAKNANFEIPEKYAKELESLESLAEETAKDMNLGSVQEYIESTFGAGCTFEDYYNFMEMYYVSSLYFDSVVEQMGVTAEEMEAYFVENEKSLRNAGYTKEEGILVDVRHILIKPQSDSNDTNYTQEQWDKCLEEAQEIYDKWLHDEQSEEYFAFLASMYTKDTNGSVGGLYENVVEGDMVAEFNDWCFDETRQKGDTGLIKTQLGYHIMYFSGSKLGWEYFCSEGVRLDKANELWTTTLADVVLNTNYRAIALADLDLT